jgi:microcystin-dependent protein
LASTFTPALQLEEPARGDYVNSWDLPANANYTQIDNAIGGVTALSLTTGTVNLTQAQANSEVLALSGTLTGNVIIVYPATTGGRKLCIPSCVFGGFTVRIIGNAGSDAVGILFKSAFGIPYPFIATPARIYWDYAGCAPGSIVGFPTNFIHAGWLVCDGTLYNTVQYDLLFDILGYAYGGSGSSFGVPDYRGYADVGSDNMGGPAGNAGRFFNVGPNFVTGELNHVLTDPELAAHTHGVIDNGHTHGASQAPHNHTVSAVSPGFAGLGGGGALIGSATLTTSTAQPAITVNPAATGISIASAGSNAGHNNVQPSRTRNIYIRW